MSHEQLKANSTNSLAQNRAEEFGFDLFNEFVIPPIFEKIDFNKSAKSKIFIGGRGCGKTMLLRYLSHETTFSKLKKNITEIDIRNIGLYWKVDTHMVYQLQKRNLESDIWGAAFEHLMTIVLSLELIKSLESIAESNFDGFNPEDFAKVNFRNALVAFDISVNLDTAAMISFFKNEEKKFHFWLGNVRKREVPNFLPKIVFETLVEFVKLNVKGLSDSNFNIYIDEYENLIISQQRIINTWVKHSENPVIFHLAMKRNAFQTKNTVGNESLSHIHDYRIHDLEEKFANHRDFMVFAAEILLYRLECQGNHISDKIDAELLKDPSRYYLRKKNEYQNDILELVEKIFPTLSHKELAQDIFNNSTLNKRFTDKITQVLKHRHSNITLNLLFMKKICV